MAICGAGEIACGTEDYTERMQVQDQATKEQRVVDPKERVQYWRRATDLKSNKHYYWHTVTKDVRWTLPEGCVCCNTVGTYRRTSIF